MLTVVSKLQRFRRASKKQTFDAAELESGV
jgi:hypothetical protein